MGFQVIPTYPWITNPYTPNPAPTITPATIYDYEEIADALTDNDSAEKLCRPLYPVDSATRDVIMYNELDELHFIVYYEIYPEVGVLDDTATVQFTKQSAIISHRVGYQWVSVTDPNESNKILQAALALTNGNRGYKAFWIIDLINGRPSTQQPLKACVPIPYNK